jgi:hypothetical protein
MLQAALAGLLVVVAFVAVVGMVLPQAANCSSMTAFVAVVGVTLWLRPNPAEERERWVDQEVGDLGNRK